MYLSKRLPIGWIRIRSDLADVDVYPSFTGVELQRKMITKKVGSPEDYIVSVMSEWSIQLPTCALYSR